MIRRPSARFLVGALIGAASVLLVIAMLIAATATARLTDARNELINTVDPELTQVGALTTALLNQETAIRGYLLVRQDGFLQPYQDGVREQEQAVGRLRALGATGATAPGRDLDEVLRRAGIWQRAIAAPVVAGSAAAVPELLTQGKTLFDDVRGALTALQNGLQGTRDVSSQYLRDSATVLNVILIVGAGLLLVLFGLLYAAFRRLFVRPVERLAGEVRMVATEDIEHHIAGTGPKELVELAADTEAMRRRIVDEVDQLRRVREALERSNSDLEQFAYVASHDLQEPLRKIAGFTQLLQQRYQDQLDERGNEYIGFAVDGAKRMQKLINDLLAFSRVGRRNEGQVEVGAGELVSQALANLAPAIDEAGAKVTVEPLPVVLAAPTLLTAVFQNLIGNAIKFRGEQPPEVLVTATRDGEEWIFEVSDNGLGIEPEYAERIFAIFQRLHGRDAYPGTGIGLAMCRKIVEYHGGRVWLDVDNPELAGSRFRFTLPALPTQTEQPGET